METNKNVVPLRVSEAEEVVLERRREIFYDHGSPEEKDALEDALQALKSAWQQSEAA